VVLQQHQQLELSQLAFGVFAAALGEADVATGFDELVVGWDVLSAASIGRCSRIP
jgi:hypothetical protein